MDLHGYMNPQPALEAGEIVISDIFPNRAAQLLPAGEASAIVTLPLEDTLEVLHGPVINALTHSGLALRHPGRNQLVVEDSGGVLKPLSLWSRG